MLKLIILLIIFTLTSCLKINGAKFIATKFLNNEIYNIFGYAGGNNLKLLDELNNNYVKIYSNKHEQFSGYSAEAYSKVSKKLGVLITTSGPGITNAITPIQDAYSDGIPLLIISGQVPSNKLGTSAFQECNATSITSSCVKKNILVKDVKTLIENFDSIVFTALENRKGPVHLDICANVFYEEYELNESEIFKLENTKYFKNKIDSCYNINFINEYNIVFKLLKKSLKPVIIVGQGVNNDYKLLRKFINEFNIPICSTLHALGSCDNNKINYLGMIGMHGSYQANKAVSQADLIIGIGNRFDDRTIGKLDTFGIIAKKKYGIVHIDNSIKQINEVKSLINPNISICDNSRNFFNAMLFYKIKKGLKSNKFKILNIKNINNNIYNPNQLYKNNNKLTIPVILNKLSIFLNNKNINPIITTGVGVHQMQVAQYYKFNKPINLITSGSQGTMGTGLPFAIGCQIAKPDKLVICIDGDGSFQMSSSDLITLKQYNLPVKILIMDNKKLQMVHYWQKKFFNSKYTISEFINPDFVKLSESCGIEAYSTNSTNNLDFLFDKLINSKESLLIHFDVEDEDCLPFVPPNNSLDNMILD